MKSIFFSLVLLASLSFSDIAYARCDYPDDRDSAGRRCGGRAASVIPGGRLGGTGHYTDSQNRNRIYGRDNDPYDRNYGNSYGSQKNERNKKSNWTYR